MNRKLLVGLGMAAFLAVELFGLSTSEAQILRNLLRRNNNRNNTANCQNCGYPADGAVIESSPVVSEGAIISDGGISGGGIISEGAISEGSIVGAPMEMQGIVESPMMASPVESYPINESYNQPMMESYGGESMSYPTESYSQPAESFSQPAMESYGGESMSYPTESYPSYEQPMMANESIMPVDYSSAPVMGEISTAGYAEECAGCQGMSSMPIESASWNEGQVVSGETMVQGDYVDVGASQVMGCADGNCGGAVMAGDSIQGNIVEGNVIQNVSAGNVVYESPLNNSFVDGGSAEQIISSEIISEQAYDEQPSSTSETVVAEEATPAESVDDTPAEAPETEAGESKAGKGDKVPDAPPASADDDGGKEA